MLTLIYLLLEMIHFTLNLIFTRLQSPLFGVVIVLTLVAETLKRADRVRRWQEVVVVAINSRFVHSRRLSVPQVGSRSLAAVLATPYAQVTVRVARTGGAPDGR